MASPQSLYWPSPDSAPAGAGSTLIPKHYIPWVLAPLSQEAYKNLLESRLRNAGVGLGGDVFDTTLDAQQWSVVRGAYRICLAGMKRWRRREQMGAWMTQPNPLLDNATPLAILHDPRLDPLLLRVLATSHRM